MRNLETLALLAALLMPRSVLAAETQRSEKLWLNVEEERCGRPELPIPCHYRRLYQDLIGLEFHKSDDGRYYGLWRGQMGKEDLQYEIRVGVTGDLPEGQAELQNKHYEVLIYLPESQELVGKLESSWALAGIEWWTPKVPIGAHGASSRIALFFDKPGRSGGGDNPFPGTSGSTKH